MKRSLMTIFTAVAAIVTALDVYGTTNYWDNNSSDGGFGTASGTWGVDGNWSIDDLGLSVPVITNTAAADMVNFGTLNNGLATGTIIVDSTNQSFKTMTFGTASGIITLSGGEFKLASPLSTVKAYSPTNIINTALTGTNSFCKFGSLLSNAGYLQTNSTIILPAATLADFGGVEGYLGGGNVSVGPAAEAFYFVNNGTNATVQLQRYDGTYLKCLLVEFTQVGANIAARVVDARYVSKSLSNTLGYDFETQAYTSFTIATAPGAPGYGVAELSLLAGKTHEYFLTESATVIFPNAALINYTRADGCMGGSSMSDRVTPSEAYHYKNNGVTNEFQLQIYDGGHTKCIKVELTQRGPDIAGRVVYAKHLLNQDSRGHNFDLSGNKSNVALSSSTSDYGAAKIVIFSSVNDSYLTLSGRNSYTGDTSAGGGTLEIAKGGQLGNGSYAGKIVTNGKLFYSSIARQTISGAISGAGSLVKGVVNTNNTPITNSAYVQTSATVIFSNKKLSDYASAGGTMQGGWMTGTTPIKASVFHYVYDGIKATAQFQAIDDGYTKCVRVEFTQVGNDIAARGVDAKNVGGNQLGYNFDAGGSVGTVATSVGANGYGVAEVTLNTTGNSKLTLSGNNSYSGGTVIDAGVVEATLSRASLPSKGGITVNRGCELLLNVSGLANPETESVGGNNPITVNEGRLTLAQRFNAGPNRPITINGGTLNSTFLENSDSANYVNDLTLMNGATVTGNKIRMGYFAGPSITVSGSSASSFPAGITMVKNNTNPLTPLTMNVADVTGDAAVDLSISGDIRDYTGFENMPILKTSAGTVSFSGVNTHQGVVTISAGTLALRGNGSLNTFNPIVLNGGTLDMGAFTNTVGTLTVTAVAGGTLTLGSGKLSFADSSAITWNGTLTLTNTLVEQSVRFGTTKTALTLGQLTAITYNNGERVRLDKDGYLTTKPQGTIFMIR